MSALAILAADESSERALLAFLAEEEARDLAEVAQCERRIEELARSGQGGRDRPMEDWIRDQWLARRRARRARLADYWFLAWRRHWEESANGNPYIRQEDEYYAVAFRGAWGDWRLIAENFRARERRRQGPFRLLAEAQRRAYDLLITEEDTEP